MENKNEDFLFDSRIARRNIRDGRVSREEYEKYLQSLPDLSESYEDLSEEVFDVKKGSAAHVSGEYVSEDNE